MSRSESDERACLIWDDRREAVLVIAAGDGYPGLAPSISLEGRCGVKNEDLIAMRRELEKEVG